MTTEHTVPHSTMNCGPGLDGLNQVDGSNLTFAKSICCKYTNMFSKHTNKSQFDILMTVLVDDIRKGQTDMPYKREHQTLTKQNMRHQVCPGASCHITISESTMIMLMASGRSNWDVAL